VAHHLVVGFDRIAIASNACRDGSERLLDALHAGGAIVHVHNEVPEGEAPQHAGYRQLRAAAGIDDFDWAMALDADEFLNVHAGDHRVQALIAAAPEAVDIIALNGMTFGDGGRDAWAPGRVCAQFTRRLRPQHRANASVKSLTRGPARFKAFHNHSMVGFRDDAPLRVMWADGRIEELPPRAKLWQHLRRVAPEEIRHDLAQYNHYAVKTWDSFLLRRSRGNGAKPEGGTDRWDRAYFDTRAKGGIEDTTILRHAPAVEAALADLRALPGVAEAEAEVHARYRALLQAALREAG